MRTWSAGGGAGATALPAPAVSRAAVSLVPDDPVAFAPRVAGAGAAGASCDANRTPL